MAMYAVRPYNGPYGDFEISTLFWGALIFLALFVSCFLAWKAIERLRNRRQFDGAALEGGHARHPEEPSEAWADQAISRPAADYDYGDIGSFGGLGGMNQREQEELLLFAGTRKQRKAIKERRKAREQAQKSPR